MTNTQSIALLALIILALAIIWISYWMGRREGQESRTTDIGTDRQVAIEHRRKAGTSIAQAYQMPAPALIRDSSIDAQKTNSCCEAAGITAFPSAAPDVPLPHEKLREAAKPEGTLNAQQCPHAQLVVGYTDFTNTQTGPVNEVLK
jgi:hypothetical protein